jgi:hypothetical protein
MPRKPRKKRNKTALTWQKTLGLIQSIPISTFKFKNDEERREAWRHNKAAIMALQGKPLDIGTDSAALQRSLHRKIWFDYFIRPMAWFEYDRHEILTGHPDKRTLFFDADVDQAPKNAVIYEDQKQYLIANNLLNAAEKRLLRAEKAKNE